MKWVNKVVVGSTALVITGVFSYFHSIALFTRAATSSSVSISVNSNIVVYFAGLNGWSNVGVHISIGENHWQDATATSGSEIANGQYKVTYSTSSAISTLYAYFTHGNGNQYAHPNAAGDDYWNTNYSTIDISGVTSLLPSHSYVITYTSWDHQWENNEHFWFNYTFGEL